MRTLRLGLAAALVAGCAASPAPKPKATPAASASPNDDDSPPEGEDSEVDDSESSIPRATILAVKPVAGVPGDLRVKIRFINPTPKSCRFTAYTLVWPDGRKTIEEKPFEIPPGGSRMRSLRLHPNDGDFSRLKAGADVEVNAGCADLQ